MISSLLISKVLFIFLIISPFSDGYYLTGYQIRDLEKANECFIADTPAWSATKIVTDQKIWTQCGQTYLIGGYNVLGQKKAPYQANDYFSRTYTDLPPHTMIYFAFSLWLIDSWNSGDYFQIQIGSITINGWNTYNYADYKVKKQVCGTDGPLYPDVDNIRIFGRVPHTGTSFTFKMISQCDQDSTNESIGFRDMTFLLASSPPTSGTTQAFCGQAINTIGALECQCPEGSYMNSVTNKCATCHSSCSSCWGSEANECYECKSGLSFDGTECFGCTANCKACSGAGLNQCLECKPGYLLYYGACIHSTECVYPLFKNNCDTTCDSPCKTSEYIYDDLSCPTDCNLPLKKDKVLDNPLCTYPCDPTKEFLYWDGTCETSCDLPLLVREPKASEVYCDYKCNPTTEYLYWDGTCSDDCLFPLKKVTEKDRQFCTYPCQTSEFLYWDGECESECLEPLTERTDLSGNHYCDYKCSPTTEYLYWDKTCSNDCLFPLKKVTEKERQFCTYPCKTGEFLYWNGDCEIECPIPLTERTDESGNRYCDYKCNPTEYLYWDGSCSSHCSSPLLKITDRLKLFCEYPCDKTEYLHTDDIKCKTSCGLQYTHRVEIDRNYCDKTCSDYQLWNGACVSNCNTPLGLLTNISGTFCHPPCDNLDEPYYYPEKKTCNTTCSSLNQTVDNIYLACYEIHDLTQEYIKPVTLSKLLHHIRYIDMQFPEKLGNISIMRGTNILSPRVIPKMFKQVTKWPERYTLPKVFEYYFLPSSFLANFGGDLILLGMILAAAVFSFILEKVFSVLGRSGLKKFFNRIRIMTQWNLPIMIVVQNTGDIFFFAVVEFRTLEFTDTKSFASFGLCLLMLALVISVYLLAILLIKKSRKIKKEATKSYRRYTDFITKWEKFQVLFRGYNDKSFFTQSFLLIYSFRLLLPMLIASSSYMIPLFQTLAFITITGLTLLFLVIKKPIRNTVDLINLIVIEFLILTSDLCLLCLVTSDDETDTEESIKGRDMLANTIILCNFFLDIAAVLFLILKIARIGKTALQFRDQKKHKPEQSAWLQLFFLPLQQGSLGFEQFQIDTFSNDNMVVPLNEESPQTVIFDDNSTNIIPTNNQSAMEFRNSRFSLASTNSHLTNKNDMSPKKFKLDQTPDSHRSLTPDRQSKYEETVSRRKRLVDRINLKAKESAKESPDSSPELIPQDLMQAKPNNNRINNIRRFVSPYRQQRLLQSPVLEDANQNWALNSASRSPLNFDDSRGRSDQIGDGSPIMRFK